VEPPNQQRNLVSNTKYNLISFVPVVLFNQFKFFLNMFFLLTALTQLVPALKVGLVITYLGPLLLVLTLTMAKEAVDDYKRYRRDLEVILELCRQTAKNTRF
jgi:phospholipid-translocating ATPase